MYVHVMVQCNLHLWVILCTGAASAASEPADLITVKPPHGLPLAVPISHTVCVVPVRNSSSVSHVQLGGKNAALTANPTWAPAGDSGISAFCLGDRVTNERRSSVAPLVHDRLNAAF